MSRSWTAAWAAKWTISTSPSQYLRRLLSLLKDGSQWNGLGWRSLLSVRLEDMFNGDCDIRLVFGPFWVHLLAPCAEPAADVSDVSLPISIQAEVFQFLHCDLGVISKAADHVDWVCGLRGQF